MGDSRIESHSWFLQGLSPRLFKDLIAENFSPPRDGEPPFELDLTKADVALPDGVPEMLGPAIAFYRRYSDKEVLELLKQPENLEDFEGRFLPNALKLMTCGEFLGMGEEPPQEKGEGSAQGRAEGDGDDDDDDDEDEDEDDDDDDDDEDEDEDDGALELVRHVQHSVLKQMKKAWKWFCCNPDDGITEEPAGSSSITYDNENASYFEARPDLWPLCLAPAPAKSLLQCILQLAQVHQDTSNFIWSSGCCRYMQFRTLSIVVHPFSGPCCCCCHRR